MNIYTLPENKVTYNYRYFLPYAPEWGSDEFCQQRLDELLLFCDTAQVDAVQFFVNILPGTYYMPAHNADEQRHWAEWMKTTVRPALQNINVSYQLNFQMILGATSYDSDMRSDYEWDCMVNQYGDETLGSPCNLSEKFRDIMGGMLELWASTKPDIIWIDDDFRMHNHGLKTPRGDCDFYCYCDIHLDRFAEFTGKRYSRAEVLDEVLKPGLPSKLRSQWREFLGNSMTETAGWINRCIHNISPRTRIALMTSVPDVHSTEGRNWHELLKSLCGDYIPMTRPMSGLYTGTTVSIKQNVCTYKYMSQSMATLKRIFGNSGIEFGPELENTRFTTWSKSVANSQYVMILGQLLGSPQITLSLNDLDGSPIDHEPTTMPLLRGMKPKLAALAELNLRHWQPHGVIFIDDEQSAAKVQVSENAKVQDLGLIRDWEDILLQCGIPAYHASCAEAAAGRNVVVLEGYTAWLPSDDELKIIMSGSVLLDADAAFVVQQRGFGAYLGVHIGEKQSFGCLAEKYRIGTINKTDLRIPYRSDRWRQTELQGAEITSEFIDSQNNYYPASMIYENTLGGRLAVYNNIGDMSPMGVFGDHARLEWLHNVLNWLSEQEFPVLAKIPHHALTICRERNDETLLALANLGTDMLKNLSFDICKSEEIGNIEMLTGAGEWVTVAYSVNKTDHSNRSKITFKYDLSVFEWFIVKITNTAIE